ncbi:MAG: mechanosensitive ion channel family protein [Methanobrevibacter sp.]|nr:mechanosensitive ion channel family protein [Methanobrevibacter sp.]
MNLNYFQAFLFIEEIIAIVIILIVSHLLINALSYLIKKFSRKIELEKTLEYLAKDLSKYLICIIALILILELLGVNVSGIFISLGIIGIIFGFAAQDVISNFMSGIFLLADKTVKVGEVIDVGNAKGVVKKLGFRTTTLITSDNLVVTIPNSVLSKNHYTNHTYFDETRVDLEILIPYEIDLDEFKSSSIQSISKLEWVLNDIPPRIIVKEMNETGINLKISAWFNEYPKIEEYRMNLANVIRKQINTAKEKNL